MFRMALKDVCFLICIRQQGRSVRALAEVCIYRVRLGPVFCDQDLADGLLVGDCDHTWCQGHDRAVLSVQACHFLVAAAFGYGQNERPF